MLIVATVALMVGLGAVMASMIPVDHEPGVLHPRQSPRMGVRSVATAVPYRDLGSGPTPSPVLAWDRAPGSGFTANRSRSSAGAWRSPLDPQNGVTLWERIRASSPQDHGAAPHHAPPPLATLLRGTPPERPSGHIAALGTSPPLPVFWLPPPASLADQRYSQHGLTPWNRIHAPAPAATPDPWRGEGRHPIDGEPSSAVQETPASP